MPAVEDVLRNFSDSVINLCIKKDYVTENVLNGLGKGFLSGLNDVEISWLKRLIDSLR